ncbi:unknown [Clostridium sp. CAG:354]|jgi:hypothetical protein|nr:hypothetical protein [Clostridium sp.]MEE0269197.1 hypothetical protein [Clostridia bacterium]OKZ60424.1 MAG: hypothetical protein BHV96_02685 [Clostridium sp. CAG:354_28_25]CDE10077.1 unknown [Clostridium sp. CAG:354]
MSIDFQKEKERIELKNSQYVGSIGIYMEYSEKIEDTSFKYYFYNGIEPEEAINFTTAMFSSLIEEQMNGQKSLNIKRNLLKICNKEYVFDIYVSNDNTFLFDWNPELDELEAAQLLFYASINLAQ